MAAPAHSSEGISLVAFAATFAAWAGNTAPPIAKTERIILMVWWQRVAILQSAFIPIADSTCQV